MDPDFFLSLRLKDYHPILRRIIIHGISCWWKKAFPAVLCLFSEIDRVLCFMRKRTRGQGIRGRVRGESHQRRYNLVILRMFEIQAPDYWTFILLAGLLTRLRPLPLPFRIQPFLYFRLEAIPQISHMALGSAFAALLLNLLRYIQWGLISFLAEALNNVIIDPIYNWSGATNRVTDKQTKPLQSGPSAVFPRDRCFWNAT